MTMTDTGVKPIPAYVPPEDGKPRNAVDEKWRPRMGDGPATLHT